MSVKFFCKTCNKEIWKGMPQTMKETTTIAEAENQCECSDCLLKRHREEYGSHWEDDGYKNYIRKGSN